MKTPEEVRARARERMRLKRASNPEFRAAQNEASQRWRKENHKRHVGNATRWQKQNPDKKRENARKYGLTEHGREKKRLAQQRIRARLRLQQHFEYFMARLLAGEDVYGFEGIDIVGRSFPKTARAA